MLRIQLLGPVAAVSDGVQVPLGGPKQQTVLAVLTSDPGQSVSVDRLTEAVWGDDVPDRASRSISTYVSNLRGVLGDVIVRDGNGYVARLNRDQVDAADFADRVQAAQQRMSSEPADAAAVIREALKLWTGEPFQGIDGHHVLEPEVTRLTELRVSAIETAIEADIEAGDCDLVELDFLVAEHPDRERIRGLQMRALYASGRQADALASYNAFRDRLATDLGLDPSPELQELELRILQQDPTLAHQEVRRRADHVAALPARYSSFVGRDDEVAAVVAGIATDRLLTVVGPGGIGKSSLVVEAARRADVHQGDGVARVVVDTLAEGEFIDALVGALGLDPAPGVDPVDVIVGYLGAHRHLVVLDGCEAHLDVVARLVDRLLSSGPTTRVVVTSREPLGLPGETVIRVTGLDEAGSVDLFLDRAKLDSVDDEISATVRELCVALEGMPLAIELAAARARSVSLGRLAARIDDLIPLLQRSRASGERHDSIAAALGWSYDLLEPTEQRALRWLSLFPTGADRRDAEAVLDDPYAEDVLARLVEVSLVQPIDESGRYRMLEPVRQYAAFLLAEDAELESASEQYARWIAQEAKRVAAELWSPQAHAAASWVHNRRPDIIAAMDSALAIDQPDFAVTIVASLGRQITFQGRYRSVIERCVAATSHANASRTPELAIAMAHTVLMLWWSGRSQEAQATLERAERCAEATQDPDALAQTTYRRIVFGWHNGGSIRDTVDELGLLVAGLNTDDPHVAGFYLWIYADLLRDVRRFAEAEAVMAKRAAVLSANGVPDPESLDFRGEAARMDGDLRGCIALHLEAIDLYQAAYAFRSELWCWTWVALAAIRLGDAAAVDQAIDEVRRTGEMSDAPVHPGLQMRLAVFEGRFSDVLDLGLEYSENLTSRMDTDRVRLLGSLHESVFLVLLLPVAHALEAIGRVDDARRISTEAPGVMARSEFASEKIAEDQLWADLHDRLGGGEPKGLTVEETFDMVHEILAAGA